jgi:transcriptional regulator with XRE-family HTH domain
MGTRVARSRIRTNPNSHKSLLQWRLSLNLSQREAARVFGFSQGKYSRLERGVGVVVRDEARKMAALTGVPPEVLAGVA